MARATTALKERKKLSKTKVSEEKTGEVEDAEVVSDAEAEKIVEIAGSALDSAKEPEHDAERALDSKSKKKQFPTDVWENVCDRDIKLNIGRPIVIRSGDKVKIVSSLRRAIRQKTGSDVEGVPNLKLIHSEDINDLLVEDERIGMQAE